jgi:hypothetical protein
MSNLSFCSHKFKKIVNYFDFEHVRYRSQLMKNLIFLTQNIVTLLPLRNMGSCPVSRSKFRYSGKNLSWIPDPEIKKAPDPGSATQVG